MYGWLQHYNGRIEWLPVYVVLTELCTAAQCTTHRSDEVASQQLLSATHAYWHTVIVFWVFFLPVHSHQVKTRKEKSGLCHAFKAQWRVWIILLSSQMGKHCVYYAMTLQLC